MGTRDLGKTAETGGIDRRPGAAIAGGAGAEIFATIFDPLEARIRRIDRPRSRSSGNRSPLAEPAAPISLLSSWRR